MQQNISIGYTKTVALRREVVRKYRQVGLWRTLTHGVSKVARLARQTAFPPVTRAVPFDLIYGTDTGGVLGVGELDIPEEAMEHAVRYDAISEEEFDHSLKELPVTPDGLVFVDLGSGKGRALLLASCYPFAEIIGVEFSRLLHETALHNIEIFQDTRQRCRTITSIWADASKFEIPEKPLMFFLHNPFDDAVMRPVVSHIEQSLQKCPRTIYVWYVKPEQRQVFDASKGFEAMKDTGRYVFYKSKAG